MDTNTHLETRQGRGATQPLPSPVARPIDSSAGNRRLGSDRSPQRARRPQKAMEQVTSSYNLFVDSQWNQNVFDQFLNGKKLHKC